MFSTRCQRNEQSTARSDKTRNPCNEAWSGPTTPSIPTTAAKERRRMCKSRLLSARILIFSSRACLLIWETGRRSVVMNGAEVLGHVISERRPAGSEFEARHVLGVAAFLPGSALSDGTSSVPCSGSRDRRGGLANPVCVVTGRSSSCQRARRTTLTQVCVVALQHFFTK